MKTLVLVAGKARSGKDTVCKEMMECLNSAQWLDITGELKRLVAQMFGMSPQELEENKDEECITWGDKKFTARHFLQFVGNDIAPGVLGKWHWCVERQEKLFQEDREVNILCGVRQLKEVEFFKRINPDKRVVVLKMRRLNKDGTDYSPIQEQDKAHSTETEVDLIEEDYLIEAKNGEIESLYEQISDFLAEVS